MNGFEFCQPCGFHHPRSYDCEASRARERLSRLLLETEQRAYAAGRADGFAERARQGDRVWAAQPPLRVSIVPSFAELEALRWGPGGREHFGDPRPSDRYGRHLKVVS